MYPVIEEWKTHHHLSSSIKWGKKNPESNCQFTENGEQSDKLNDTDRTPTNKTYPAGSYATDHPILRKQTAKNKTKREIQRSSLQRRDLTEINTSQCVDL